MANIGFNDNSSELFELYDKSDKNSGVGYIDNYDGLQMSDLLNSGKTLKKPIIVEELPTNGVESQIYLVKNQNSLNDENMYIEYLWVDGKFEQIGGTGDGSSGGGGTCEEIQRIDKNTIDKLFD